jgi:hypothetical protein
VSVRRLHRRLFLPGKPATGTLHVAGHRGGDELTFKLTRPRYNRARRTVSYKVKRVGNGSLPSRAAQAAGAARRFGAASLSIVPAPQVAAGDNGGNDCEVEIFNNGLYHLQAVSSSTWPTDNWAEGNNTQRRHPPTRLRRNLGVGRRALARLLEPSRLANQAQCRLPATSVSHVPHHHDVAVGPDDVQQHLHDLGPELLLH